MGNLKIDKDAFRRSLTSKSVIEDFAEIGVEAIPRINEDAYSKAIEALNNVAEIISYTDENDDTIKFYHDIKNLKKRMETYLFNYKMWQKTHKH